MCQDDSPPNPAHRWIRHAFDAVRLTAACGHCDARGTGARRHRRLSFARARSIVARARDRSDAVAAYPMDVVRVVMPTSCHRRLTIADGAGIRPHARSASLRRFGLRGVITGILLGTLLLSACGKKGSPEPPGPPDKITWPRVYPTH